MASGAKLTLSDDAHGTSDVGFWYDNLHQYLATHNVSELYYLEKALVTNPSTRLESGVVCRKMEDWSNHPFWSHCGKNLEKYQ